MYPEIKKNQIKRQQKEATPVSHDEISALALEN